MGRCMLLIKRSDPFVQPKPCLFLSPEDKKVHFVLWNKATLLSLWDHGAAHPSDPSSHVWGWMGSATLSPAGNARLSVTSYLAFPHRSPSQGGA